MNPLAIKYLNKTIKEINTPEIKAQVIEYDVEKEDLELISKSQTSEYKINRLFLYKDWGTFELVVDNIEDGRVLQGGIIEEKCKLAYYIVEKGLQQLLFFLTMNEPLN